MFTEAFPILSTRDLPRLRAFYLELLGWEQVYQFPADGRPQYVGLRLGGSHELGIGEDAAAPGGAGRGSGWEPPADPFPAVAAVALVYGYPVTTCRWPPAAARRAG